MGVFSTTSNIEPRSSNSHTLNRNHCPGIQRSMFIIPSRLCGESSPVSEPAVVFGLVEFPRLYNPRNAV